MLRNNSSNPGVDRILTVMKKWAKDNNVKVG